MPFVVLLLMFGFFGLGYGCGHVDGEHYHQIQAVKAGHAEWVAQPDGTTVFKWK